MQNGEPTSKLIEPKSGSAAPEGPEAHNNWERYGLPADMTGKTFLDVGCWEGENCVEAVRRGASQAVGLDLCTSDDLRRNVESAGFEFVQMDIFSEKFLQLDTFDVVLCGGVLYHVENVISLLFRLRRVAGALLVLETKVRATDTDEPILVFKPRHGDMNPSNWWVPNRPAVEEMLITCGFRDVETVWEKDGSGGRRGGGSRVCVHAIPTRQADYERALPRRARRMPLAGGFRTRKGRKERKTRAKK